MKNELFITYAGNVEFVTKTEEKTNKKGKLYKIRSLALNLNDVNPEYPVTLVFDVLGNEQNTKKIDMLDGITKGEEVMVTFTINSRPYVDKEGVTKYFVSLNLIKVDKSEMNQDHTNLSNMPENQDDLPF